MNTFTLHPQPEADTHKVLALSCCELLLMDDSRFPWLILVPRIAQARELHTLPDDTAQQIQIEVREVSKVLAAHTQAYKMNTGALGNVVEQLHLHVIARFKEDAAWPNPVWGFGTRQPYAPDDAAALIASLVKAF